MADISLTADKALLLIDTLAQTPDLSLQAAAARVQLNRTVVLRLLGTLQARGFVVRSDGLYSLSPLVRRLAEKVHPGLRAAAEPVLVRLAESTKATAVLHVLDGNEATVLRQAVHDSNDLALI